MKTAKTLILGLVETGDLNYEMNLQTVRTVLECLKVNISDTTNEDTILDHSTNYLVDTFAHMKKDKKL